MAASLGRRLLEAVTSRPIPVFLAGITYLDLSDDPPYFISTKASAGFGVYSAASLALGARTRSRVALHAVNMVVQAYKIGSILSAEYASPPEQLPDGRKTRVVVLGSGWGSMSFIKNIRRKVVGDSGWYDLTVVSPRNYFLYTPLLPGAVTGTVEQKSIVESVRSLLKGKGKYYEAECVDVDPVRKVVKCKYVKHLKGMEIDPYFEVPYDVLVVGVGAVVNTFNTPGVQENCYFLKEMSDADILKQRVHECFELAALPTTTPEVRKKLLTFTVVGGGPTGVETAAEIHDMVQEDMKKLMPELVPDVSIKVVETQDHILGMYDREVSKYTEKHFSREGIELLLKKLVLKVEKDGLQVKNLMTGDSDFIPSGTTVWCTGIKLNPFARTMLDKLPSQDNARAIKTDGWLRVKGSEGTIFALGDASTIEQRRAMGHAEKLFEQGDANKNGLLSCSEIHELMTKASKKYPQLAMYDEYFSCSTSSAKTPSVASAFLFGSKAEEEPKDESEMEITLAEFKTKLDEIDKTLRALPATAQVANQEGRYLGQLFSTYRVDPSLGTPENLAGLPEDAPAFKYKHLGSFAYVGADKAVMEIAMTGKEPGVFTGWLMGLAWKGLESWMQISARNKYLVSRDWVKAKIFGRDLSDV